MALLDHIRLTDEYMSITDTIEKIAGLGEPIRDVIQFFIYHKIEKHIRCFYCYEDKTIVDINDGKNSQWEIGTAEISRELEDELDFVKNASPKKISSASKEKYKDYFWKISEVYDFEPLTAWLNEIGISKNNFLEINAEKNYPKLKKIGTQIEKKSKEIITAELSKKYLEIIGAMLEERKIYQRGLGRSDRVQDLIAITIEDMTKDTDAKLSAEKLRRVFSTANKEFNKYKIKI